MYCWWSDNLNRHSLPKRIPLICPLRAIRATVLGWIRTSRAASTLSKSGSNTDVESGEFLELLGFGELSFDIVFTSLIVRLGFRAEPSTAFFPATTLGAVVENQ
jgi:hypothetical protein